VSCGCGYGQCTLLPASVIGCVRLAMRVIWGWKLWRSKTVVFCCRVTWTREWELVFTSRESEQDTGMTHAMYVSKTPFSGPDKRHPVFLLLSLTTVNVTGHIMLQPRAVITAVRMCHSEILLFWNNDVKHSNRQPSGWKLVFINLVVCRSWLEITHPYLTAQHSGHYIYHQN
jgi:hypothetical protein